MKFQNLVSIDGWTNGWIDGQWMNEINNEE